MRKVISSAPHVRTISLMCFIVQALSAAFSQEISFQRWFDRSSYDVGFCVRQTADSGYIIAGQFVDGSIIVKTDKYGDTVWTRPFSFPGVPAIANAVVVTNNGDYVVAGGPGFHILKVSSNGTVLWTKSHVGENDGFVFGMTATLDGGFVLTGPRRSPNVYDLYVLKVDHNGDSLWAKMLGGPVPPTGVGANATSDSGCIVIGSMHRAGPYPYNAYVARLTSQGDTLWTRFLLSNAESYGSSVQQTRDGGFVAAGSIFNPGSGSIYDGFLVGINAIGDTTWKKIYARASAADVVQTTDSGYIVAGQVATQDSVTVPYWMKANTQGEAQWIRQFDPSYKGRATSVRQTSDNGYIVTGTIAENQQPEDWDIFLLKSNSSGLVNVSPGAGRPQEFRLLQNYPNPFNPTTTILFSLPVSRYVTVEVFNIGGEKLVTLVSSQLTAGEYSVKWSASGLPSGVYFYRLHAGEFIAARKMALVK